MAGQFEGKVALVTGGGMGIGRATALAFAKEGAKVVIGDILVDAGQETVSMIEEAGGTATFIKADVSKADDVKAMVDKTIETHGRLDFAHNNAGIEGDHGSLVDCTEENWNRTIDINLKGVWLCMKYEIPHMLENGGGAIVNTASVAGLVAGEGLPAYFASKHGVVGLTRAAALENAKAGIRVNAVCPGAIRTPMIARIIEAQPEMGEAMASMHPVGRIGEPEEIAAVVVWLCSDAASFVTGHPMAIDGGLVAS